MSGHSKWSTIKRKKGAADAKRGALFTRLANAITVAAKQGGGDPETNFALRLAMDKAREGNMPSANVDRAIKRGTGELAGQKPPEEIAYEGYGPGGVALLVQCLTDNKNRTVSEVRSTITKRGGSLGEAGSVAYLFTPRGVMSIPIKDQDPDQIELDAIEAGAEETAVEGDTVEIETAKDQFAAVRAALSEKYEVSSSELTPVASATVPVTDAAIANSVVELMAELEELDDVVTVSTNAEIEPSLVN
jgi:YebC/PmpR family DNA-binding regulatory protein